MVTRPALERLRPGSIDCESSSVNLTGHVPTLPRNTATGAPGESTDLATMNKVAPAAAFALKPAASDTSPLTAVPESNGKGGSCRARALLASPGRPRNSYDFASSSQSSAVPPPLASRPCREAIALPMDPASAFGAGLARLAD